MLLTFIYHTGLHINIANTFVSLHEPAYCDKCDAFHVAFVGDPTADAKLKLVSPRQSIRISDSSSAPQYEVAEEVDDARRRKPSCESRMDKNARPFD